MNFELLESQLGLTLPEFYKNTISSYPFKKKDELDFVEDNLVKDEQWVLESNKTLRENGFFEHAWPQHLFAIGHDGFDNYAFLNLLGNDSNIYLADNDFGFDASDLVSSEYARSMQEYIDMCLEDQQEIIASGG